MLTTTNKQGLTYQIDADDKAFRLSIDVDGEGNGLSMIVRRKDSDYEMLLRRFGSVAIKRTNLDADSHLAYVFRRVPPMTWPQVLGFGLSLGAAIGFLLLSL